MISNFSIYRQYENSQLEKEESKHKAGHEARLIEDSSMTVSEDEDDYDMEDNEDEDEHPN